MLLKLPIMLLSSAQNQTYYALNHLSLTANVKIDFYAHYYTNLSLYSSHNLIKQSL